MGIKVGGGRGYICGSLKSEVFFCCLSVYGYISGGWEGLYLWELIIGGIFLLFISRWVYKWGGGGVISGGAYNRRYFLLFVGRWVYKWEGRVFYSVVFGMFDGSTI